MSLLALMAALALQAAPATVLPGDVCAQAAAEKPASETTPQ